MEDSEIDNTITARILPESSFEITSAEAEPLSENNLYVADPLSENNLYVAESIEVVSADDSIICLDEVETSEELPPNDETPLNISSTNLPVVIPFTSDFPASPSMSYTNDNDDDFCIVFEKKAPPSEVQILENYVSSNTKPKKKHRTSQNPRPSDQSEYHNQQEVTELTNSLLDDSISIIDARVVHVTPSLNQSNILNSLQNTVLDSNEKKKRKIECGVCFDGPDEIEANGKSVVSTVCGHIFCSDCIKVSIKSFKHCPQCRKKLTMKQFHVIYV